MRTRMGVRELRNSLTATLRRVRAGETIEVTHHGEPIAILAPVVPDRIARLIAAGDVTPGTPFVVPRRLHQATSGRTASQALEEDRGD